MMIREQRWLERSSAGHNVISLLLETIQLKQESFNVACVCHCYRRFHSIMWTGQSIQSPLESSVPMLYTQYLGSRRLRDDKPSVFRRSDLVCAGRQHDIGLILLRIGTGLLACPRDGCVSP